MIETIGILSAFATIVTFFLVYILNITRRSELPKFTSGTNKKLTSATTKGGEAFIKADGIIIGKDILLIRYKGKRQALIGRIEFLAFMFLSMSGLAAFFGAVVLIAIEYQSWLSYILFFVSAPLLFIAIMFVDSSRDTRTYSQIAFLDEVAIVIDKYGGSTDFLSLPCHFDKLSYRKSDLMMFLTLGVSKLFECKKIIFTDNVTHYPILSFFRWQALLQGEVEIDEFNKVLNMFIRKRYDRKS